MRLVSLKVYKTTNDEVIRDITFNEKGLSLIVDETKTKGSRSNIGKTIAVKIIDLCLGAKSVSSIYKDKDTGEDSIIKTFLKENKVVAKLICLINEEEHSFIRALYPNGKNYIDDVKKTMPEYKSSLNKLCFDNSSDVPTIRELMKKFIRLDFSNEDALLKFLGNFQKNYKYQAIYDFLFGIGTSKSKNITILEQNEIIGKDIEAIFRKNSISSLEEFSTKIELEESEVKKFKQEYSEVSVIDDYNKKYEEIKSIDSQMHQLENNLSNLNLQKDLMVEKIKKEKEKIFSVDINLLKKLYDETKLIIDSPIKDFEEFTNFHNGMVKKRIEMLDDVYSKLLSTIKTLTSELEQIHEKYESNYVNFNVELKEKFEEKYSEYTKNKMNLENSKQDYEYIIKKQKEIAFNLSNKTLQDSDEDNLKDITDTLNKYFRKLTENILRKPYAIVIKRDIEEDEFPIEIIGAEGKLGTGIKKAMITCFDFAHVNLIIEKKYHMPHFLIHDKMENIPLEELEGIIAESRNFEGQYILPILSDRIDRFDIKDEEIILKLSTEVKFFKV
ncbi:MAG: hypothetical protein ACPKNR_13360 [Pleomorphochaeta sp.]